jgi:hypothetical protein
MGLRLDPWTLCARFARKWRQRSTARGIPARSLHIAHHARHPRLNVCKSAFSKPRKHSTARGARRCWKKFACMNTTTTMVAGNHAHTNRDANALSVSTLTQSLHRRAKKRGGEIQFGSISASSAHFLWLMREERYAT